MSKPRPQRSWSAAVAGAAVVGSALLSGCGLVPSFLTESSPSDVPMESPAADRGTDTHAQEQFFDNAMLIIPMVASLDPASSWSSIEPAAWGQADPTVRETVVGMGLDACTRADVAAGAYELEDPAMTWLAARFICPEHREAADEFLSNDASISATHSMADLFELALVRDDASADDLLTANTYCIGALALAWEVHANLTPEVTCWLIRVQSAEETAGNSEYLSLFTDAGDVENTVSDARFAELAELSGATPNELSGLLEGVG